MQEHASDGPELGLGAGVDLRAKRTHARRSCDVCKIRKTRCELPDLEIPSGPTPLPTDKSCHRCRILNIPCVVDDASKKPRKRPASDGLVRPHKTKTKSTEAVPATSRTSRDSSLWDIDQSEIVDVLNVQRGGENTPIFVSRESADKYQAKNLKLHGRPLEIVCAMMNAVYVGRSRKRTVADYSDVDLQSLVNADLRLRLESGMAKLRTFHPHLDTLPCLFTNHASDPSVSSALLLSLVIYLASLSSPFDPAYLEIRARLHPYIISLRDDIMLNLPESFVAIQALEMLAQHAPLGVLPAQMASPRASAVARGQVGSAVQISNNLRFPALIKRFFQNSDTTWDLGDNWLWLGLCVQEAALGLEEEIAKMPASLPDAMRIVSNYMREDYNQVWSVGLRTVSAPQLVGHLALCDRVSRLWYVMDTFQKLHGCVELLSREPNFDALSAVSEELRALGSKLDALDVKHDAILALISPTSNNIESGWLAYRMLRRRFELARAVIFGQKVVNVVPYMPGTPLAFPGLPSDMIPAQKVSYAYSRTVITADVLALVMATTHPASQSLWSWGLYRQEICESVLAIFAEFAWSILGPGHKTSESILVPLHDCFCMAVESAKSLMEPQAAQVAMQRRMKLPHSPITLEIPSWWYPMRELSDIIRNVANIPSASMHLGTAGEHPVDLVASACSDILGAFVRLTEEWKRASRKEEGLDPDQMTMQPKDATSGSSTLNDAMPHMAPNFTLNPIWLAGKRNGRNDPFNPERWIDADMPGSSAIPNYVKGGYTGAPTAFYLLLSQVLGSYNQAASGDSDSLSDQIQHHDQMRYAGVKGEGVDGKGHQHIWSGESM